MYIFISHSSSDAECAQNMCKMLEENGQRCFIAPRDIEVGSIYAEEIVEGIDRAELFLLLLSKQADASPHVLREVERACSKGIPIFVYKLEDFQLSKAMEYFIMTHQWVNHDTDPDFSKLIFRIKEYERKKQGTDITEDRAGQEPDTGVQRKDNAPVSTPEPKKRKSLFFPVAGVAGLLLCVGLGGFLLCTKRNVPGTGQSKATPPVTGEELPDMSGNGDIPDNSKNNESPDKTENSNTPGYNEGSLPSGGEATTENGADELKQQENKTDEVKQQENKTDELKQQENNTDELKQQVNGTDEGQNHETEGLQLKVGDTLQFGWYQDEPISWRVIRKLPDGNLVLVSSQILSVKCFDAAESGAYNHFDNVDYWSGVVTDPELLIKIRGNNDWETSNIRTWLNSTDEVVGYSDTPPKREAMSEYKNGYSDESGFLYGFYELQRDAIVPYETRTTDDSGKVKITTDLVFLLSREEVGWMQEAGLSLLAAPTDTAQDMDQTNSYFSMSTSMGYENFYWLLRDAYENSSCKVYLVENHQTENMLLSAICGAECFGIRPAICIDPRKLVYE